ncbi:MAG: hypothetical protein AAFQ42_00140 [Pseudomonadota bacterium]
MTTRLPLPGTMPPDLRTSEEFRGELAALRYKPLNAQLRFLRNARNRDRALSISQHELSRLLGRN